MKSIAAPRSEGSKRQRDCRVRSATSTPVLRCSNRSRAAALIVALAATCGLQVAASAPAGAYNYKTCTPDVYSSGYFTAFMGCSGNGAYSPTIDTTPYSSSTHNDYQGQVTRWTTRAGNANTFTGGSSLFDLGGYVFQLATPDYIYASCGRIVNNTYSCRWHY